MPEPQNIPTAPVGKLTPYQMGGDTSVPKVPVGKLVPHEETPTAPVGKLSPYAIETAEQARAAGFDVHHGIAPIEAGKSFMAPPEGSMYKPATDADWEAARVAIGQHIPDWAVAPLGLLTKSFQKKEQAVTKAGQAVGDVSREETFNPSANIPGGPQMFSEEGPLSQGFKTPGFSQVPAEISGALGEFAGSTLADPTNWPFMAQAELAPVMQKLISSGFAAQMSYGAAQHLQQVWSNWDKLNPAQKAHELTALGLNVGAAGAGVLHAAGELTGGTKATKISDTGREAVPAVATPSRPANPDIERLKTLGGLKTQGGQMGPEGRPGPVTRTGETGAGQRQAGSLAGGQRAETTAIAPQESTVGTVTPKPQTTQAGEEGPIDQALRLRGAQAMETPAEKAIREHRESPAGQAEETSRRMIQQAKQPAIKFQRAEDIANARTQPTQAPTAQPAAKPSAQPVSAPGPQAAARPAGEPVRPQQAGQVASIKMMITRADEARLKALGYSQTEINKMTPPRAGEILDKGELHPRIQEGLSAGRSIVPTSGAPEPPARPLKPLAGRNTEPVEARSEAGKGQVSTAPETPLKTAPIEKSGGVESQPRKWKGGPHPYDEAAQKRYGKPFNDLDRTQRNNILQAAKRGEAGFASFGGKKPASKKAAQAEALNEAIKQDKPHKIIEKLDSFVRSIPEGTVDQRVKEASEAIAAAPSEGPAKQGRFARNMANLTSGVKIFGEWFKNGEKNGIKLRDALKGNTDPKTGLYQALGRYNEARNVGAADAHIVIDDMMDAHNEDVLKAIHLGLDSHNFDAAELKAAVADTKLPEEIRKAAHMALNLTPEERTAAEHYDSFLKETGELMVKTGSLRGWLENYVPHMVETEIGPGQKLMSEIRNGVFDTSFKYARQRIHETMLEGARKGVQYQLGIHKAIFDYHRRAVEAIGSNAFKKELFDVKQQDQRPALVTGYNTIKPILPEEYSKYPAIKEILDAASPKLRAELADAYMFHDNRGPKGPVMDANVMDQLGIPYDEHTLTENDKARMDVSDYKHVEHPSFKEVVFIGKGAGGKPVFYRADVYAHPAIYDHLKNIYEKSQFRTSVAGRAALKVTAFSKNLLLKVLPSGFHYTQEGWHAVGHGVNPFKQKIWNGQTIREALNDPTIRKGMRGGLELFEYSYNDVMEGIKGVRGFEKDFNNHLFGKFIPGLKIETFKKQVAENLKIYRPKGYSEQRIYEMTAQQVNNAYGMQNKLFQGRREFHQDLFRLLALAPDFLESRARFIGGAARPGGHRQRVALMRQFLYMYGTARVLNSLTNDGDAKWGVKDMFTWHLKGHQFSIRSVLTDAMFAATAPSDFLITRGALGPKAIYETGKEAGKPAFLKDKIKGGVTEGAIRNTVPIMLQRPTMALYRKFYEQKYGKSVAWEAFAGMLEAALGIRESEEPTVKQKSSGLPGLSKLSGLGRPVR